MLRRENVHGPICTSMNLEGSTKADNISIIGADRLSELLLGKGEQERKSFLLLLSAEARILCVRYTLFFSIPPDDVIVKSFSLLPARCVDCVCESFAFTHPCVKKFLLEVSDGGE